MASIIDPLGKRCVKPNDRPPITALTNVGLMSPENHDTPTSRDIFSVARLERAVEPILEKPSAVRRALRLLTNVCNPGAQRNFTLDLNHDDQQQLVKRNSIHRRLPEEHVSSWQAARDQRKADRERGAQKFRGPVPRQGKPGERNRTGLSDLERDLSAAFLTPLETEIVAILQNAGRTAYYKDYLKSYEGIHRENLLVHSSAVEPLQRIQTIARGLSDGEKRSIVASLESLIAPNLVHVLKILLFQPDVWITDKASGPGSMVSPAFKPRYKPTSVQMFSGRISPSWGQTDHMTGGIVYADASQQQSPFSHFSQRDFIPQLSNESFSSPPRLHLRGGGGHATSSNTWKIAVG